MQVTFDPTIPEERELVRRLMRPLDGPGGPRRGKPGRHGRPHGGPFAEESAPTDPQAVRRGLNQLLSLGCGEFLALAAAHFEPEAEFTVPGLAEASGVPVETLLSKNRTLGHSCRVRGLKKRDYLAAHGGAPRRFSLPQWVHDVVGKQAAAQAEEQAGDGSSEQAA
ncbi:hypothetical protein [Alienimonas californiensis]|uniref:Uncharacterized protein n=1 Tax=Alienimonas californiensis TaxID=2527989 RepID=A0A517P796_9PLAN|nr:hypothetical protein [Alienimonas californiensis]QDT15259.1 hypothetical protein CA12_13420 [Alienimonas californiensis]